jgi:hypothetical protein
VESLPTPLHTEKKQSHFSPPAGSKAACVKLQKKQVSIMHHMLENNPTQHLARLKSAPFPQAKLKNVNNEL